MKELLPVIAQDQDTGEVLMLAWADREALRRTLESGEAWYWSRSRQEYWHKGAASGNTQELVEAWTDCDRDAVLIKIRPKGPACHTGKRSCFFRRLGVAALDDLTYVASARRPGQPGEPDRLAHDGFIESLEALIAARERERPEGSYVAGLLTAGPERVLQKVGEEAVEFILAAAGARRESGAGAGALVGEAADLLFHLLVAMRAHGLAWSDVLAELQRRHVAAGPALRPETNPGPKT